MGTGGELRALAVASAQHGVLSRAQARAAGLSQRRIRLRIAGGQWVEVFPGVYRLAGAPPSWPQRLAAAALWAGRGAAFSHRTAAALWGFARYAEGPVELSCQRGTRASTVVVTHRPAHLSPGDLVVKRGFRVTTVTRTLLDLCAGEPRADVRASVDEALRRKWTTLEQLKRQVTRAGRHRGVPVLRELMSDILGHGGPSESELEARVEELLEAEGLPRPIKQQRLVVSGQVRRLDFRIPGTNVVIEADGYAWHSSPDAFERDRARNNALAARGLVVLHWTWAALFERPEVLAAQLRQALRR